MPDLISSLLAQPQRFDLFQALHLIERAHAGRMPVGSSLGLDEAVRLSSPVSLDFVPSDIVAVCPSTRPGPPLTLSSAVMALAGAQGPLPLPFTEMVIDDARRSDRAAMAFLDIFHQRLLGFLYRSRRKHHVALTQGSLKTSPVMRALDALSGLGHAEGARGPDGQRAWFRHAGLQGAAPRSMASLLAVVRDRLGIALEGRSFVGAWHPLADEERARLSARPARVAGDRAGLGIGVALGARAWVQGLRCQRRPWSRRSSRPFCLAVRPTGCSPGWWHGTCSRTCVCSCRLRSPMRQRLAWSPAGSLAPGVCRGWECRPG